MNPIVSISVDWLLITRCLIAVLWGIGYALLLQFEKHFNFLREYRTWIVVVVGIGVDLLIAFNGSYWTVAAVIAFSSFGIVGRSLINESKHPIPTGYRVIWSLESAQKRTGALIAELAIALETGELPLVHSQVSRAIGIAYQVRDYVAQARNGKHEPEPAVIERKRRNKLAD